MAARFVNTMLLNSDEKQNIRDILCFWKLKKKWFGNDIHVSRKQQQKQQQKKYTKAGFVPMK